MATGEEEVLIPPMVPREVQGLDKETGIPFGSGWERDVEGYRRVVRVIRIDRVLSANMHTCLRLMTKKIIQQIIGGS